MYRSPSSTNENNDDINNLISEICNQGVSNNFIIGDFNYQIDWSIHDLTINDNSTQIFYEVTPKIF